MMKNQDDNKEVKKVSDVLQPTGDLVYVKSPSQQEYDNYKSKSGIILSQSMAKDEYLFDIIAVGPMVTNCKIGDKVILDTTAMNEKTPVRVCNTVEFIVIRSFQVFGVLIK